MYQAIFKGPLKKVSYQLMKFCLNYFQHILLNICGVRFTISCFKLCFLYSLKYFMFDSFSLTYLVKNIENKKLLLKNKVNVHFYSYLAFWWFSIYLKLKETRNEFLN